MILNYNNFNKTILKNMRKKDPVLYKNLKVQDISKILRYMSKNMCSCIIKKQDVYITNFFSCHMDKKARKLKILKNLPEI
jgi:hypothetical protein